MPQQIPDSRFLFDEACGESPDLKEHFEKIDNLIDFADSIDPLDLAGLRDKLDFITESIDEIKESALALKEFKALFSKSIQDDVREFLANVPFLSSTQVRHRLHDLLDEWRGKGADEEDLHFIEDILERFIRGTSSTRDFDPCKDIPNILDYDGSAIKKPPTALAPDPDTSPLDITVEIEEYFEEIVNVESTPSEEDIAEGALLQETPTQPRWHPSDRLENLHNSGLSTTSDGRTFDIADFDTDVLRQQAIEREEAFTESQAELEQEIASRRAEEAALRETETEEETQARLRRQFVERVTPQSAAEQQATTTPEQSTGGVPDRGQVPTPFSGKPESILYNKNDFFPSRFAQNNASKINRLHPFVRDDFKRLVGAFLSSNVTDGYDINICETYRSPSRTPLNARGESGDLVPGASWYNYGAAAAIYIYQNNEIIDPITRGGEYNRLLGRLAAIYRIRMPQSREMTHYTSLKLPQFVPEELAKGEITFDEFIGG